MTASLLISADCGYLCIKCVSKVKSAAVWHIRALCPFVTRPVFILALHLPLTDLHTPLQV
jgi:hypothetical protein